MRKMKKCIAAFAACAMMLSLVAGCGKGDETSTTETEMTEEAAELSAEDTEEVTEEETTEAQALGVSDGDHVIELTFDEDVEGCTTYINGGKATIEAVDGELVVAIESVGVLDYANQVYYDGFALYEGCVYNLSFDIRCDVEREIEYRVQINGDDYHAYAIDQIEIGTETQHVSLDFTMDEDSDPAPRLCFNLGKFDGMDDVGAHNIYIDNVILEATDASNAQQIEPVPVPNEVKINQVGYKTSDSKVATVSDTDATTFDVIDVSTGESVLSGDLGDQIYDKNSDATCKLADFSELSTAGTYKVVTDTDVESYEFTISDDVYDDIYKDVVLMLYNQRCGVDLDSSISGDFAHEACHTGEAVVYGSESSGTVDVSGGWHDAGDYGRYIVSGAKTVADLFLAYRDTAEADTDDYGIPESGNGVSDLLDEARFELEWMLKMQDSDGGVYHKVTCANFPETVLAVEETEQLILAPKSLTATGDFAAVMAEASYLYKDIDADFAATCLAAAENAWSYLEEHDGEDSYTNPDDIVTGEYPDKFYGDEYLWAAVELYIATGDESYKTYINTALEENKTQIKYGLGWAAVGYYAAYDYTIYVGDNDDLKNKILDEADDLVESTQSDGYGVSLKSSFPWGSNMNVANNGMLLSMANNISAKDEYVECAKSQLDYLLGRNSVSYCYVTGYGTVSPENTHHRPSQVLGYSMKGMLVGGPDSDLEDSYSKAVLYGYAIESCYVDNAQSYSCNEVTVYWNSPLIYLLAVCK